jgi:hypothetical protein
MDVRAIELTGLGVEDTIEEEDQDFIDRAEPGGERIWVIQCKREKAIGPKRIRAIVAASLPTGGDAPYGLILAAACDFSKNARDVYHQESTNHGVKESHIWGKADLEDMLFLPKYDHLLFAYFNISLQIRRRSLRTELRSRLALKRKLINVLGDIRQSHFKAVLLRDPAEERYPHAEKITDFAQRPRWRYYNFIGHEPPDHLAFIVRRCFAFIDDEGEKWDALLDYDDAIPSYPELAFTENAQQENAKKRHKYWSYWKQNVPEKNQGWYEVLRCVHYNRILAVDEHGDVYHEGPHILIEWNPKDGPFELFRAERVEFGQYPVKRFLTPNAENRVTFFPPKIPPEKGNDNLAL